MIVPTLDGVARLVGLVRGHANGDDVYSKVSNALDAIVGYLREAELARAPLPADVDSFTGHCFVCCHTCKQEVEFVSARTTCQGSRFWVSACSRCHEAAIARLTQDRDALRTALNAATAEAERLRAAVDRLARERDTATVELAHVDELLETKYVAEARIRLESRREALREVHGLILRKDHDRNNLQASLLVSSLLAQVGELLRVSGAQPAPDVGQREGTETHHFSGPGWSGAIVYADGPAPDVGQRDIKTENISEPARLDPDGTARPKTRLLNVRDHRGGDGVMRTQFAGPATHLEHEDGTRTKLHDDVYERMRAALKAVPMCDLFSKCGQDCVLALVRAERARARMDALEDAALECDGFAEMMENGAGEDGPGHRLRQVARGIRALAGEEKEGA